MRYKVIILLFCLLTIFFMDNINATNLSLIGKVIVIDAGHGSVDPGTSAAGILEKDINLAISIYLRSELIKRGSTVIMTRSGDYDLSKPKAIWRKKSDFDNRIRIINEEYVDFYISIHLNYLSQSQYSGAQVFYSEKNEDKALIIQEVLNKELISHRSIKKIPSDTYMYAKLNTPGVLIECGFLSNYKERNKLNTESYQKEIARSIAKAIERLF